MVKSNIWAMLARAYALNGNGVRFYFFYDAMRAV